MGYNFESRMNGKRKRQSTDLRDTEWEQFEKDAQTYLIDRSELSRRNGAEEHIPNATELLLLKRPQLKKRFVMPDKSSMLNDVCRMHEFSAPSCFDTLSSDCLALITAILHGEDIEALYTCGSNRLNRYLTCGGVRKLDYYSNSYFHDNNAAFARRCLQHLRILSVHIRQDSAARFDWSAVILRSTLLELHMSKHDCTNQDILFLPRTLTSFKIESANNITDQCVKELPRGLLILHIGGVSSYLTETCFADLPPDLTSLDICGRDGFSVDCVVHLPLNLTHLSLRSSYSNKRVLTSSHFVDLPRGLTRMALCSSRIDDASHLSQLPPNLVELDINSECGINDDNVGQLPSTLRLLRLVGLCKLTSTGLSRLPPSLTHLSLGRREAEYMANSGPYLSSLPRSLKVFEVAFGSALVYNITNDDTCLLPPSLTSLIAHGLSISGKGIANLPRSLKTLFMRTLHEEDLTDECAKQFPPNLTILNLCGDFYDHSGVRRNVLLTSQFVRNLPSSLTSLVSCYHPILDPAWNELQLEKKVIAKLDNISVIEQLRLEK